MYLKDVADVRVRPEWPDLGGADETLQVDESCRPPGSSAARVAGGKSVLVSAHTSIQIASAAALMHGPASTHLRRRPAT